MYHNQHHQHHHQGHNTRMTIPPERHMFLQEGNGLADSGLLLSTDAKPRLKWTAELHQRFIEAVNHLGGADKATPKTIMKLMGVPGLTLYHLKSHLQKYRLSKNLQGQTSNAVNRPGYTNMVAEDRMSEVSGSFMSNTSLSPHTNKNLQMGDAIQMQMEVQRRLHEQLEVQRHLQLRIEAQGKYLQSVLEKAQETLGKENLNSPGLDIGKIQLTELIPKGSTDCLNSSFSLSKEPQGVCSNAQTQRTQPTDCSMDSCLTTCEGSQKEQDMQNAGMGLRPYQGNTPTRKETRDFRLEHNEPTWCEDLNANKMFSSSMERNLDHMIFPVKRSSNDLSMSIRVHGEKRSSSEAKLKGIDNDDNFLDQNNNRKSAIQIENEKKIKGFLPYITEELDLNDQDKKDAASSCKELDLNGFSWSGDLH